MKLRYLPIVLGALISCQSNTDVALPVLPAPFDLETFQSSPKFLASIVYDCFFPAVRDSTEIQRYFFSAESKNPDGSVLLCHSGLGALDCFDRSYMGDISRLRSASSHQITIQPDGAAVLEKFEPQWNRALNQPSFSGPVLQSYVGTCQQGAAFPDGNW